MFNVNEDNKARKVKISEKQTGRLRSFFNKLLEKVGYVPKVKFIHELENLSKKVDELNEKIEKQEAQKTSVMPAVDPAYEKITGDIEKVSDSINALVKLNEDKDVQAKKIFNDALAIKNKEEALSKEIDNSNLTDEQKRELHKKISELEDVDSIYKDALKKMTSPKKVEIPEEEIKTIQPTVVELKPQEKTDVVEDELDKIMEGIHKDVEKPDKKAKKALDDLTAFMTYTDYKKAFFYNYYLTKQAEFSLDEVAEILASGKEPRTLLSETEFQEKRDSQIYAKETAELKRSHNEEIDKLNKKHAEDKKKFQDSIQHELDSRQAKLEDARSKNRVANSKLRVYGTLVEHIQTISSEMNGIGKIDDELQKAIEKVTGIDERATAREAEKEGSDVFETEFEMPKIEQPVLTQEQAEPAVEPVNEEKPLDKDLENFATAEKNINESTVFTDEQKQQQRDQLYQNFDNFVEKTDSTQEEPKAAPAMEDKGQELLSELNAPKVIEPIVVEPIKTEMPNLEHEWKNGKPAIKVEEPVVAPAESQKVKTR